MLNGLSLSMAMLAYATSGSCTPYDPSAEEVQEVLHAASRIAEEIPRIEHVCIDGVGRLSPQEADHSTRYVLRWSPHEAYENVSLHWSIQCSSTLWRSVSCGARYLVGIMDAHHVLRVQEGLTARHVVELFEIGSMLARSDEMVSGVEFVRGNPDEPWTVQEKGYVVQFKAPGRCQRYMQLTFDCQRLDKCVWWVGSEGRTCH
jgi:hypothetical protein